VANNTSEYLQELKRLLNGRIPAEELGSLLSESEAHLDGLKSDLSASPNAEQAALAKFGQPKAFARRILADRRKTNIWRAALWPMAILLVWEVAWNLLDRFSGMALVISNGQPFHPFSFMVTPTQALGIAFLALFLIACFRARRLFPVQIAIIAFIFSGVYAYGFTGQVLTQAQGRSGISRAEIPTDLQRLGFAQKAFTRGPLVFSGEKKALTPDSPFLVAGRYALPLWFLERGVRGNRLFLNSRATGWAIEVFQPKYTLPDATMFTTTDWNYAADVWSPHFLKSYQAELMSDLDQDKAALALPALIPARGLSPVQQVQAALLDGTRSLVIFFGLNLIAWLIGWMCDAALLIRRRYRRLA
jgi:hypothetical protein